MEYDTIAAKWLDVLRKQDPNMADQVDRSGNSLLTNTGEGASADEPKVKAKHYRIAKREAEECAVGWEKALRRGWIPKTPAEEMLALLDES